MLATDLDNPQFLGARNPDDVLAVEFYDFKALDRWKTQETGIKTYKDECPFIRIAIPGNDKLTIERPASPADIRRFPRHWLQYQMQKGEIGDSANIPGWKLDDWGVLDPETVRNLKHLRFFTVEQLASANDAQVQGIGMGGISLRMQAQSALEAKNAKQSNDEISKRDSIIEAQGKQLAELQEAVAKLLEKRGPGRPPREE